MPKTILPDNPPSNTSSNAVAMRTKITTHFPKALETLVELMDSENENIKLTAALKIIEHTVGKAPQSVEINGDTGSAEGYAAAFRDLLAKDLIDIRPTRVIEIVQQEGEAIQLKAEPEIDEETSEWDYDEQDDSFDEDE